MNKYKTLIISPHCDDEVLGCGGIMKNRFNEKVFVYYLGVENFHVVDKNQRIEEVNQVSNFLNFEYEIGPNIVNKYNKQDLINQITEVINRIQPEEIFIPNKSYNQDHLETHDACLVALRPHDNNFFVNNVFVYEVDQYKTWGMYDWKPNYFEEIDIDSKIKSYMLHKSQVRSMRPPDLIEKFGYIYGLSSNCSYAESFIIYRFIKNNTK
jgi:LmbE family N-acetylglucosaminyl deacetylase